MPGVGISQEGDGGQPGAFLRLGVGARAIGMGRTFAAIANDASTSYWNPAGLGGMRMTEIVGAYAILSMERRYNYMSVALPTDRAGTFGISWINLGVGGIEETNNWGQAVGEFSNSENALLFSWGYPVIPSLFLGTTIKYIHHSLADRRSTGLGIDFGVLYRFMDIIRVGLAVQDIATRVSWNTDSGIRETFPMVARFGAAYFPDKLPISVGMDYEMIRGQKGTFHTGVEGRVMSNVGLRIGLDDWRFSTGVYVSIPMRKMNFQTDYSFNQDPIDKTFVHRFAFSLKFAPYDYYFHQMKDINPAKLDGSLSLMAPPPDARIIKIHAQHPNLALINVGKEEGIAEGMIYEIYRAPQIGGEPSQDKLLIGEVKVLEVREKVSAVRVEYLKEGFLMQVGDILSIKR